MKYEDVIAKANGALQASDFQNAIRLSRQAVEIDPNRPQAYEIAGIAQLYGVKDLGAGATAMRAAVERGGSASFSVTHDHDGFFQTYCQGSLYLNSQGVSYRSNDGNHSFAVNYAAVSQAGQNSFVGANIYSFHIKVIENKKTRNYNFAPGTFSAAESNLILELLESHLAKLDAQPTSSSGGEDETEPPQSSSARQASACRFFASTELNPKLLCPVTALKTKEFFGSGL